MTRLTRRSLVLVVALSLFVGVGCGGGSGGKNSSDDEISIALIVQQSLPTNGQEVLPDLSDVGGVIQLRFSERLARSTVLDLNNAFNGLTSDVNVLDSGFARVPGTPDIIGDRQNILVFTPQGGVLPNGQYTVTVSRDVKNWAGRRLNDGAYDYRTSFVVGTDVHSPVIRNTFPAPNQKDVAQTSKIIITFNESLNPATVTTATVSVVDGGTNPPTPINGTLTTSRDDFEIVFTPDAASPMPSNSTIVVTITGGASGITDVVGNPFEGDPATPNTYTFQFETVQLPPPPNNPPVIDVVTFSDAAVYVSTQDSIWTLQEGTFLGNTNDMSLWGQSNPVANSQRKIGQPTEVLCDPRLTGTGHSMLYVIDRAGRSVAIVATVDSRVIHRWRDLPDPRGLAVTPGGSTLFVTNFANDSVSMIDIGRLGGIPTVATQTLKDLTKIQNRVDVQVGRGPLGAAHAPDALLLFVGNEIDNTCSVVNSGTLQVNTTFAVGTAPQDLAATFFFPGIGRFAFITCLGGGADDNGSVALWWDVPNSLQANITGFQNPKGCIYDQGVNCFVANSGGNTTTQLTLAIAGGAFAATILPQITSTVTVGKNPSGVTIEPFYPYFGAATQTIITACRGSGQVYFYDPAQPARPGYALKMPGAHDVSGYMDQ